MTFLIPQDTPYIVKTIQVLVKIDFNNSLKV